MFVSSFFGFFYNISCFQQKQLFLDQHPTKKKNVFNEKKYVKQNIVFDVIFAQTAKKNKTKQIYKTVSQANRWCIFTDNLGSDGGTNIFRHVNQSSILLPLKWNICTGRLKKKWSRCHRMTHFFNWGTVICTNCNGFLIVEIWFLHWSQAYLSLKQQRPKNCQRGERDLKIATCFDC